MTKRTLGLLSLSVSSILLINEQAAYSSDTIWDLLRRGDPSKKSAPLFGKPGEGPAPVIIDPKTGKQITVTRHAHKKPTGFLGWVDTAGTTLRHLGKQLNSDLHITGDKKVGLHMENV